MVDNCLMFREDFHTESMIFLSRVDIGILIFNHTCTFPDFDFSHPFLSYIQYFFYFMTRISFMFFKLSTLTFPNTFRFWPFCTHPWPGGHSRRKYWDFLYQPNYSFENSIVAAAITGKRHAVSEDL